MFVQVLIQLGNQAKAKQPRNQDITFITIQAEIRECAFESGRSLYHAVVDGGQTLEVLFFKV